MVELCRVGDMVFEPRLETCQGWWFFVMVATTPTPTPTQEFFSIIIYLYIIYYILPIVPRLYSYKGIGKYGFGQIDCVEFKCFITCLFSYSELTSQTPVTPTLLAQQ